MDTSYKNNSRDKVAMGMRVHKVFDKAGSHVSTLTEGGH